MPEFRESGSAFTVPVRILAAGGGVHVQQEIETGMFADFTQMPDEGKTVFGPGAGFLISEQVMVYRNPDELKAKRHQICCICFGKKAAGESVHESGTAF